MSNSTSYYPFGPAPGNPYLAYLPYDLQIQKVDPGVILNPTEANGVYVALREVNGCLWFVLNADYNVADAQWEQVSPQNAATPAYAVEYCSDGTVTEWSAAATIVPGTAVTWVQLSIRSAAGNKTTTPTVATTAAQNVETLVQLWNTGSSIQANARKLNVTDTSSATNSLIDNLSVNGTGVWQVRKDGVLVAGTVPLSHITGPYILPNLQVTGNTQLNTLTTSGLANFTGGENVTGGLNTDTLTTTGNATIGGNLGVTGNETVTGTLNVTGATTLSSLHVTGNETVDGNLAVGGDETVAGNITAGGTVTAASFKDPSGNLGSTVPAYASSSFTSPTVGSTCNIPIVSSYLFQVGQTVIVSSNGASTAFGGTVTAGNGFPATQITVQAEFYYQGTSGTTMTTARITLGNGVARITGDSTITVSRTNNDITLTVPPPPVPALGTATGYAAASTVGAAGGGNGPGTISYTLPGSSSDNYQVTVQCSIGTGGSDSATLTVTGGTASGTAINWSVGNFASYILQFYVCTATGGQTITATNSKGYSLFFQILAFRTS